MVCHYNSKPSQTSNKHIFQFFQEFFKENAVSLTLSVALFRKIPAS